MDNAAPKISVVMPVYNVEKYLADSLEAFINQTFKDIEIICVNDGSKDNSLSILNHYAEIDNRIVVINQENRGAGAALNRGIEATRGEYIYFFDSDDYIEVTALEKMYKKIIATNSDICICQKGNINDLTGVQTDDFFAAHVIKIMKNNDFINPKNYRNEIYQFFPIAIFIKLYRADFVKQNKLFFQEIKTCNDIYFNFMTISLAEKITFVEDILIRYRIAQKSNLTAKRSKHINCIFFALKMLRKELEARELFAVFEKTYWEQVYSNFKYEIAQCTSIERQKTCKRRLHKFLPLKYRLRSLKKIIIETIFSVKNVNNKEYKQITFLGIKIKIRRKRI